MSSERDRVSFRNAAILGASLMLALAASGRATCYSSFPACPDNSQYISTLIPNSAFPSGEAGQPLAFVDPHDGLGHRFLMLHGGRILVWDGGSTLLGTDFLDVTGRVTSGGERGLLAMTVHPDYKQNGFFYIYYTSNGNPGPGNFGDIVVERYTRSAGNPNVADAASAHTIIVVPHPEASNHNGGWLAFGPDGDLYISIGDGGNFCDTPTRDAQDTFSLRGKLLRVDVNGDDFPGDPNRNYAIPPDNPFVGDIGGAAEVWDYGLRNPFRFSFDRETGDIFIGDVGQDNWEEIDQHLAASTAPINFGWVCREGCNPSSNSPSSCSIGAGECTNYTGSTCEYPTLSGLFDPILCFSNPNGWASIMGGYRYRGHYLRSSDPNLDQSGRYFFSDAAFGQVWRTSATDVTTASCWDGGHSGIYGFSEDHNGELYLVMGALHEIDCLHDGNSDGCFWSHWGGLFQDDFETGDLSRWSALVP